MTRTRLIGALAAALLLPAPAGAGGLVDQRRTGAAELSVTVRRVVLPNGLTVLLAPDPAATAVLVWMTFRAGAVHEPPGRSGLAHLVEHLMASGPTPETDYAALLESRRARHFNAHTQTDRMTFESVVPAEELPLALWVAADRLGRLPRLLDGPLVERHRRVVLEERALRVVDAPYGLVDEHLFQRLFPSPHPLHGGVAGLPGELARVSAEDVRDFVATRLVPANAVLTLVGRFDPAEALRLVEDGLGRLPGGKRPAPPAIPAAGPGLTDQKAEPLSRRPRVTLAWRLRDVPLQDAMALRLGAQLLGFLADGAWGMRLGAALSEYDGESLFEVSVSLPYDEPASVVLGDAEGFLRQLTHKEMPQELLTAANLALDRLAMAELDTLEGRAEALSQLELLTGAPQALAVHLGAHWELERAAVRDTARSLLRGPRVVLHARPTRPKPARKERE